MLGTFECVGVVGVVGFEPTVSCSQSTCDNQASLHPAPDMIGRHDRWPGRMLPPAATYQVREAGS